MKQGVVIFMKKLLALLLSAVLILLPSVLSGCAPADEPPAVEASGTSGDIPDYAVWYYDLLPFSLEKFHPYYSCNLTGTTHSAPYSTGTGYYFLGAQIVDSWEEYTRLCGEADARIGEADSLRNETEKRAFQMCTQESRGLSEEPDEAFFQDNSLLLMDFCRRKWMYPRAAITSFEITDGVIHADVTWYAAESSTKSMGGCALWIRIPKGCTDFKLSLTYDAALKNS